MGAMEQYYDKVLGDRLPWQDMMTPLFVSCASMRGHLKPQKRR